MRYRRLVKIFVFHILFLAILYDFCNVITIKNCALFHPNKHPKSELSDVPAFIKGLKEGNHLLYKRLGQAVMVLNSKKG